MVLFIELLYHLFRLMQIKINKNRIPKYGSVQFDLASPADHSFQQSLNPRRFPLAAIVRVSLLKEAKFS